MRGATVIFLVPSANAALENGWRRLNRHLLKDVNEAVRLVSLEALIDNLRKKGDRLRPPIAQHVAALAAKYLVPGADSA